MCAAGGARAGARFGDSTWVAPSWPIDDDSTSNASRVATPDHERLWESVLRAPFRVVFFPLRLVGWGLESTAGLARHFEPSGKLPKPGFAWAPYITISAPNDIGVGPGVTWTGFPTADSKMHLGAALSMIQRRRINFTGTMHEGRTVGLRLHGNYDQKPSRRFYGIGNATQESGLAHTLLGRNEADGALLIGASPLRQVRLTGGYSAVQVSRGSRDSPQLADVYPAIYGSFTNTEMVWFGIGADLALVDDPNPSRGIHGRLDVRRATGLHGSEPDFDQWLLEGRGYLPMFAKRRVLVVRGMYTGVQTRQGNPTDLPFYRLVQSDHATTFAGFPAGRFRDRQLLLARVEYRWEILDRLSALALYELGEVAPEAGSFTFGDAHVSYGGGFRFAVAGGKSIRGEVARSVEGMEASLTIMGDF
jgi:hypothetical protein